MKILRQMMVFMPLVVILIGQLCREMIDGQDLKVAVIGRLLFIATFDLSNVCNLHIECT